MRENFNPAVIETAKQGVEYVRAYQKAVAARRLTGRKIKEVNKWAEAAIRAIRRTGELIKEIKPQGGGDRRSENFKSKDHYTFETEFKKFLDQAQISKRTAYNWRSVFTEWTAEEFEAEIERLLQKESEYLAAAAFFYHPPPKPEAAGNLDPVPIISLDDCRSWLEKQAPFDLLLTDPPYSTDIDDILGFAKSWLPLVLSKIKRTGRAYVFIGAYPDELAAYLSVAKPTQVLVWTYQNTLGPSPLDRYKQNWQAILYYKMPDAEPLDCQIMLEQFSVQNVNAPDGRLGNRWHEWQKPDEIAERFIRHASKRNDIVIDPFSGTGTFLLAAGRLGRISFGCELDKDVIGIARSRGCQVK